MTPNMMQIRLAAISNSLPPKRDNFRNGFIAGAAWMKLTMLKNIKAKRLLPENWRKIKVDPVSNLTPIEQVIFAHLCENGSISHEEIALMTGSYGISPSTRVHISNIRRKKPDVEIISVRGFGYKINKP